MTLTGVASTPGSLSYVEGAWGLGYDNKGPENPALLRANETFVPPVQVFHLGGGGSPGISPLKCWEKLLISGQNGPKLQSQRS